MTEQSLRQDLAAAFRWAVRYDLHEACSNHFSVVTNADGSEFLMNPSSIHFSRIRASDLLLLNVNDKQALKANNAPDPTAWWLHSYVHKHMPQARCIIHTHSPYVAALSCLKDPTIHPIDQNTARFYSKTAYDLNFGGMLLDESEGERVVQLMQGGKKVLMLGGHGVMVVAETIAEAFDLTYFVERAAKTLMLAYQTGREINTLPTHIAEQTEAQWDSYEGNGLCFFEGHFRQLKIILDSQEPDYKI